MTQQVSVYNNPQIKNTTYLPDEIWRDVVFPFVLKSPSDYASISRVSKLFQSLAPQSIYDSELAFECAMKCPQKITLLRPCFSGNSEFISEVLCNRTLDWTVVEKLQKDEQWTHLLKCMVASRIIHQPEVALEVPLYMRQNQELMNVVTNTVDRVGHLKDRSYWMMVFDYNAMSLVEVRSFDVSTALMSNPYIDNKRLVLNAVKKGGGYLKYVKTKLEDDKDVVRAAVEKDWVALAWAGDKLKKDIPFVLEMVQRRGQSLAFVSKESQNNKDVVRAAVKQDPNSFTYADELQGNKDFVLEMVKLNGNVLFCATDIMKNDIDVALAAIRQDRDAYWCVGPDARNDEALILEWNKLKLT